MQRISRKPRLSSAALPLLSGSPHFVAAVFLFVTVAALLACCVPIGLKVAIVFLFAGLHNWVELRYFLSRLPGRWQRTKGFFVVSFAGVAVLALSYLVLSWLAYAEAIPWNLALLAYSCWCSLVVAWVSALVMRREKFRTLPHALALTGGSVALLAVAWKAPELFGVLLVFLHPLVALAICDSELRRSKPHYVVGYRLCLSLIPIVLLLIWWQTPTMPLAASGPVAEQVLEQAGAAVLNTVPARFLVSALVFLELLHYGVWLVAIPASSRGWHGMQPVSFPISVASSKLRVVVAYALAASTLLLAGLWVCFGLDYVRTSEIYFTFAMVHVLAEFPFLIWFS